MQHEVGRHPAVASRLQTPSDKCGVQIGVELAESFEVLRWVMPKTVEAQRANTTAALKCES